MFIVDKPYISDFFKKTVRDNAIPVVGTAMALQAGFYPGTVLVSEERAVALARGSADLAIYTTSENSIGWIAQNLAFGDLPQKIELFKNKVKFREMTRSIFPGFEFRAVRFEDLESLDFDTLPRPFIIKPAVGFFSMGVHKVSNHAEWVEAIESLTAEIERVRGLYPVEVLNTAAFIVEQSIDGVEFAVDAYFDAHGSPVVLSILEHAFSSDSDVSDRVYMTSKEIVEDNLEEFTEFIRKIGEAAGVKNFPVHIELRRDKDGTLLPIEVNPMRFGGWCTTPDITFLAWGFNPYTYYHSRKKPNWEELLAGKEGRLFSIVVLDNSTGVDVAAIESFDYDRLLARFEKPLELRKIDYKEYPVFGFLFTETRPDNYVELKNILDSDLSEFIATRP